MKVSSERTYEFANDGTAVIYWDSLTVNGYLEGDGQAALTDAERSMKSAMATPRRDLVLVRDDGQDSDCRLLNGPSLTGVTIESGPRFPGENGNEHATQRQFSFTAKADYLMSGQKPTTLVDWTETVEFSGGGPLYIVKPALIGPPQRQLIYEQTASNAKQTGYAVGLGDYPDPPSPIWYFAWNQSPASIKKAHPRKRGSKFTHFRIDWAYEFNWTGPLFGLPTQWPAR